MEAHDFSKELDIKLLKGGTTGTKKTRSIKTLKESVMSVGVATLVSEGEEEESNKRRSKTTSEDKAYSQSQWQKVKSLEKKKQRACRITQWKEEKKEMKRKKNSKMQGKPYN